MSRDIRQLIFVDTETGGLDPDTDPLVELTYAPLIGDARTLYFGVESVPVIVDSIIGFTKRGIAGKKSTDAELDTFVRMTEGQTMVAANPAFDKSFLDKSDLFRFHYRMLDIESYAMRALDLRYVPSMKDIHDILTEKGHRLTEPDHTSRNDVLAMRDAYDILRKM